MLNQKFIEKQRYKLLMLFRAKNNKKAKMREIVKHILLK